MSAAGSNAGGTAKNAVFGNVFVTGGTGLLGSELVAQLLSSGECSRIVCLVRDFVPKSRFFAEKMNDRVIAVNGDLRDQNLMDRVLNEYEINTVFHLAAQTIVGQANARPTETLDVNIRGTWALLEAARLNSKHVRNLLIASSDKAYGNLKGEKYDESFPLAGEHPYDVSKSCMDLICQSYAKTYGMNIGITRCGNFFGPGDLNESRIFPSTILSALKNESPQIRSDGKYIRDYIYVSDGASAYRHLARKMAAEPAKFRGEAFNFSYELKLTVLEVVDSILKAMNSGLKPTILNESKHEIPVQSLDSSKAVKLLQWKPDLGFQEGVKRTVEWYEKWYHGEHDAK
ncbi:MAG: GDP-mannose 4,6-dehydratase [Bdellovibrionales bacterium]|nr:GDP-mannose 4,6-dehydratase [Bdellovibrionales bacterium]